MKRVSGDFDHLRIRAARYQGRVDEQQHAGDKARRPEMVDWPDIAECVARQPLQPNLRPSRSSSVYIGTNTRS